MKTDILTLAGIGETHLSATDSARTERDRLLILASSVATIASADEADAAARAMRALKGFTRQIEDSRVTVKNPILELGKRVDSLARELTSDLENESTRLSRMLGAWQAEERRKEEEAQRKARAEEERIYREAQEKERVERERIAREERERAEKTAREERERAERAAAEIKALEEKAARARSEDRKAKAAEEAEKARAKAAEEEDRARFRADMEADQRRLNEERAAQEREEQTRTSMVQARVNGNAIVAKKPAGVATRTEIEYEVTDIVALYEAAPYLVKMEPNVSALKAALKGLQSGQNLPGVKHWESSKTHVR